MKQSLYIGLQKKFGGQWIASSKTGQKVYASAKKVNDVFKLLKKNKSPRKKLLSVSLKNMDKLIFMV